MSPNDRAKAVVAYFPAIPKQIRQQLEDVITRAINREVDHQLAKLQYEAKVNARRAEGRGKSAKGRDPWAIKFHREWEARFKQIREQRQAY